MNRFTFPTKRLTRPSLPTAEGKRFVMSGVTERFTNESAINAVSPVVY